MSGVWVTDDAKEIEKLILFLANNPTEFLTKEDGFDFSVLRKNNRALSNMRIKVLSVQERHFISFGIIMIRSIQSVRMYNTVRRSSKEAKLLIKNKKLRKISNDRYAHSVLCVQAGLRREVSILIDEIRSFLEGR